MHIDYHAGASSHMPEGYIEDYTGWKFARNIYNKMGMIHYVIKIL